MSGKSESLAAGSLILASASPRRRELLASLGVAFHIVTADVVEHEDPSTDSREMVAHNAALKADWVANRHPECWVLGADTTVFLDDHALNKPADLLEARTMLRRLSGRTHTVFTGLAIRHFVKKVRLDRGVSSTVRFKEIDEETITTYLNRVHTLDKAGGYAIQEEGELIIAAQEGSFFNIVGLPIEETKQILTELGLLA
ncbi:MAG: septum formation protein Maf [Candidatus Synoicihabitans palmerolidicus]|nr:septum formation protein Maf [Candidatus Synoicihabitans palmerolidicus]